MNGINRTLVRAGGVAMVAALLVGCGSDAHPPAGASADGAAAPEAAEAEAKADELAQGVIAVEGMTCSVCVSAVRRELSGTEGVASAEVSLADRQARVRYDPAKASTAELAELIDAGSFTASVIEPDEADGGGEADEDAPTAEPGG